MGALNRKIPAISGTRSPAVLNIELIATVPLFIASRERVEFKNMLVPSKVARITVGKFIVRPLPENKIIKSPGMQEQKN